MGRRKRHRKPRSAEKRSIASPSPKARAAEAPAGDRAAIGPGVDRWRPWLLGGLVALLVLRPLFPSESAALEGDGLVVVMLWIALAVFWLLGAIGRPWFRVRFGWTDAAVLLLIGWHTMAALWAANHGSPRPALNMLWEWIAYGLSYLLARQLIASRREMRAVIVVMIALAVALAGYGLYQHLWELPATRAEFERDPDAAMRKAGLWFEQGSREFELFRARLDTFRPMATFGLTNSLAGYLAPWLVMAGGIGACAGLSRREWRTWLAVVVGGVPVGVCLVLTSSRSACGAAVLGLLLAGVFCRKGRETGAARPLSWRLPAAIAGAGAILVAVALVVGAVRAEVFSAAAKSLRFRVQYWQSTLRMIADHPVAGCGPGNFQDAYTRYMLPQASEEIADPHNFAMEVWATAGTPAMLALLAVLGCFGYAMRVSFPCELGANGVSPVRPREHGQDARATHKPMGESSAPVSAGGHDATRHVLAGAACGFLLSVLVGQMSSAPPSVVEVIPGVWAPVVVLLGLPLAAATVLLFWRWVDHGPLTPSLPAIGVVVLLVNLLAAGAMGFPGVVGTFWLLVAMGLSLTEASRPFEVPRSAGVAALAAAMAAALTCSATALNPVLRSQTAIRLAQRDLRHADQHLRDAAQADPLAAAPQRHLAERAFGRWLEGRSPKAFEEFEASIEAALNLAPHSASTWRMCGDRYREAFEKRGFEAALPKAVFAYRRAVDLYPNDAPLRASLAITLRAEGDEAGFRRQAAIALELDEQTPHRDKKLAPRVRDELRRALSRSSSREE
ncbi:MAG TPA: O-antigen ligase family protein [Thermoguttaceae bacterium]|nr:O-antigen ligase family protein [Thermoguttaceae bacterium]